MRVVAHGTCSLWSQLLTKFIQAKAGLTQDRAEGSTIELVVVRNDGLREWIFSSHNDVAAVLSNN